MFSFVRARVCAFAVLHKISSELELLTRHGYLLAFLTRLLCREFVGVKVGAILMVVKKGGLGGKSSKRERLECSVDQETNKGVLDLEVIGGSSELKKVRRDLILKTRGLVAGANACV